ncbi:hypothetical protein A5772_17185 [Mycolicibacter sinensis]|uniref:Uncharacterized protein n=1 Tax=Mycolicibacter sinensis (strain JDM601) TaxID=875328 RepID=A0A1A2EXH6_MYCSD|nr:hypothetical protein A5772_17185 [Mycolicibacter sinensis]OBG10178.1 hypothetical protein A5771_20890 [Mycolicibacter sinensis]
MTVGAITVTAQATSSPDQHDKQGSGDIYLAISGDLHLATTGDFYMATDTTFGASSRFSPTCHLAPDAEPVLLFVIRAPAGR